MVLDVAGFSDPLVIFITYITIVVVIIIICIGIIGFDSFYCGVLYFSLVVLK